MNKLLKPVNLVFYPLMFVTFFFIGLIVAGWLEVGKGQMLAGGAIVLGWGVMFAIGGFIVSFVLAYFLPLKTVKILDLILLAGIIVFVAITYMKYKANRSVEPENINTKPTETTRPVSGEAEPTSMLDLNKSNAYYEDEIVAVSDEKTMGMGFFSPNYYEQPVLYFYGNPNLEKSMVEHIPTDSITFRRNKYNQFEIASAPPWLVADHMKLDYDMLYFKIESVTEEFVEVNVNSITNRTAYVSRQAGNVQYWPEFFLGNHSVEFLPDSNEKVRNRSFKNSGVNEVPYSFMRPLKVKEDWMFVLLIDDNFKKVGSGWIQWKRDGKLLVLYNLLS